MVKKISKIPESEMNKILNDHSFLTWLIKRLRRWDRTVEFLQNKITELENEKRSNDLLRELKELSELTILVKLKMIRFYNLFSKEFEGWKYTNETKDLPKIIE